jgi:hypothetical protein
LTTINARRCAINPSSDTPFLKSVSAASLENTMAPGRIGLGWGGVGVAASPPAFHNTTPAANDATRDTRTLFGYTYPPSSPTTTRRSSANAPQRAGASHGTRRCARRREEWESVRAPVSRTRLDGGNLDPLALARLPPRNARGERRDQDRARASMAAARLGGRHCERPFRVPAAALVAETMPCSSASTAQRWRSDNGRWRCARRGQERVIRLRSCSRTGSSGGNLDTLGAARPTAARLQVISPRRTPSRRRLVNTMARAYTRRWMELA